MPVFLFPDVVATSTTQLTVGSVLDKVRLITQDTDDTEYRDEDSELIGWLNDAISTILQIMPRLFSKIGTHNCTAGVNQVLVFPRAVMLLDAIGVPICDQRTLTLFAPGWDSATPGAAKNYMQTPEERITFRVYPPAVAGAPLQLQYVESPTPLAARADVIPLPESYEPALIEYIVGLLQLKEDESINFQRQQSVMQAFVARVTGQQIPVPKP